MNISASLKSLLSISLTIWSLTVVCVAHSQEQSTEQAHQQSLQHSLVAESGAVVSMDNKPNSLSIFTTTYQPYNYQDDAGKPEGYSVQIINALIARLEEQGIDSNLEFLPWARTYHMARTQKNALIFSIARTEEREELFHWVGRLLPMPIYLIKHKSRTDIKVNNEVNSKKWFVEGVIGGATTPCLEKLGYQVHTSPLEMSKQLEMMEKGRLDLLNVDFPSFEVRAQNAGINAADFEPVLFLDECSFDLYVALSKNSDEKVLKAVTDAWQAIEKAGLVNQVRDAFEKKYKPFH